MQLFWLGFVTLELAQLAGFVRSGLSPASAVTSASAVAKGANVRVKGEFSVPQEDLPQFLASAFLGNSCSENFLISFSHLTSPDPKYQK